MAFLPYLAAHLKQTVTLQPCANSSGAERAISRLVGDAPLLPPILMCACCVAILQPPFDFLRPPNSLPSGLEHELTGSVVSRGEG